MSCWLNYSIQEEIERKIRQRQAALQGRRHCNSEGRKAVGPAKMENRPSSRLLIERRTFACGTCSWMDTISMLKKRAVSHTDYSVFWILFFSFMNVVLGCPISSCRFLVLKNQLVDLQTLDILLKKYDCLEKEIILFIISHYRKRNIEILF